jgi:hypothetical protein
MPPQVWEDGYQRSTLTGQRSTSAREYSHALAHDRQLISA